jgi:hypothetical protein
MDNVDGNLPTSISKVSKLIIIRDENPIFLKISEPTKGSHENPLSSNSKMPD